MQQKIAEKKQAIILCLAGKTYKEIREVIPVSKSTLSLWLRDEGLSEPQRQRITGKRIAAQKRGAQAKRSYRLARQNDIYSAAQADITSISKRELWYIGIALYWAEGNKEKPYRTGQRVSFSNSDPDMITLFLKWASECLYVSREDIQCDLYIHKSHSYRLPEVVSFWSLKTGFPLEHFRHIYFKKNKIHKDYRKNTGVLYNGLIRVNIKSSTALNRRITGWIQGIIKIAGSSNGRTRDFESRYKGPTPFPAANVIYP
jgi:hypothetical protein